MKLLKACLILFMVAGFSACEVQGTVVDTVDGTPSKADTVLPAKFANFQKADSLKFPESIPKVFKR